MHGVNPTKQTHATAAKLDIQGQRACTTWLTCRWQPQVKMQSVVAQRVRKGDSQFMKRMALLQSCAELSSACAQTRAPSAQVQQLDSSLLSGQERNPCMCSIQLHVQHPQWPLRAQQAVNTWPFCVLDQYIWLLSQNKTGTQDFSGLPLIRVRQLSCMHINTCNALQASSVPQVNILMYRCKVM